MFNYVRVITNMVVKTRVVFWGIFVVADVVNSIYRNPPIAKVATFRSHLLVCSRHGKPCHLELLESCHCGRKIYKGIPNFATKRLQTLQKQPNLQTSRFRFLFSACMFSYRRPTATHMALPDARKIQHFLSHKSQPNRQAWVCNF